MNFSELWRLSGIVYKEISFQSIFSLRAGSMLPHKSETDIKKLVSNAQINTLISKMLTAIFLGAFGFIISLSIMAPTTPSHSSKELLIAGGVSAYLAVVLFLITIMGLQVSTTLTSSKIAEILSTFPLTKSDISKIILICFLRVFDIPLMTALILLPLVYYIAGGSLIGVFTILFAVCITEIFALTLTIGLARFFNAKIAGGGGRSKWKKLLRFFYMLVWILPSFGIYFVMNFALEILHSFASLTQSFSALLQILALVYPFCFGFITSFATIPQKIDYSLLTISLVSSLAYLALAIHTIKWLMNTVRRIGLTTITSTMREEVKDTLIKIQPAWLGIIRKDLRAASRAPSYASILLLPVIQTVILAMSFSSFDNAGINSALGILIGLSITILLLPITMLSIEGIASSYTRSLPLRRKTLITAKTLLTIIMYMVSIAILTTIALLLRQDFTFITLYGAIHAFSIAAASMLELTILANKFWKEGFAIGNIYTRLSTYLNILIPGAIMALIPITAAITTYITARHLTVAIFIGFALPEFIITAFFTLRKN